MEKLPPGPRSALLAAPFYLYDACGYYAGCVRRYGDPFTLPTPFGKLAVTGKPEGIQAILTADPATFDIFAKKSVEPFLGAHSLMLSTGAGHVRDRRLLMPNFHGASAAQHLGHMASITREAIGQWTPEQPLSVQEEMHKIALEVILRVVFGVTDGSSWAAALRRAIHRSQATINPPITFLSALRHRWGGIGPWANFLRATEELDRVVYGLIAEMRAGVAFDGILSKLQEARYEDGSTMTPQQLRDTIVSLVAAGHETLSSALSWALYWLHRTEPALAALRTELSTAGDSDFEALLRLPYLDAVCQETLRFDPILPEVTRLLTRPFDLCGHTLPAGMGVGFVATLVHMNPAYYPEPGKFRPERFLERKYSAYEFVPFGGGTHRCLGASFAIYEMKVVLTELLRHCRFRLDNHGPLRPRRRSVPFGPGQALVMRVAERSQKAVA